MACSWLLSVVVLGLLSSVTLASDTPCCWIGSGIKRQCSPCSNGVTNTVIEHAPQDDYQGEYRIKYGVWRQASGIGSAGEGMAREQLVYGLGSRFLHFGQQRLNVNNVSFSMFQLEDAEVPCSNSAETIREVARKYGGANVYVGLYGAARRRLFENWLKCADRNEYPDYSIFLCRTIATRWVEIIGRASSQRRVSYVGAFYRYGSQFQEDNDKVWPYLSSCNTFEGIATEHLERNMKESGTIVQADILVGPTAFERLYTTNVGAEFWMRGVLSTFCFALFCHGLKIRCKHSRARRPFVLPSKRLQASSAFMKKNLQTSETSEIGSSTDSFVSRKKQKKPVNRILLFMLDWSLIVLFVYAILISIDGFGVSSTPLDYDASSFYQLGFMGQSLMLDILMATMWENVLAVTTKQGRITKRDLCKRKCFFVIAALFGFSDIVLYYIRQSGKVFAYELLILPGILGALQILVGLHLVKKGLLVRKSLRRMTEFHADPAVIVFLQKIKWAGIFGGISSVIATILFVTNSIVLILYNGPFEYCLMNTLMTLAKLLKTYSHFIFCTPGPASTHKAARTSSATQLTAKSARSLSTPTPP